MKYNGEEQISGTATERSGVTRKRLGFITKCSSNPIVNPCL